MLLFQEFSVSNFILNLYNDAILIPYNDAILNLKKMTPFFREQIKIGMQ
jgi:hypothetical protein